MPAAARQVTLVTWDAALTRYGPGILLRDLGRDDPQVAASVSVLVRLNADVILLTSFDYDAAGAALAALQDRLAKAGAAYPYAMALRPNTGIATGLDLDHDGTTGGPRDAQGYGRFAGQAGMTILSRLQIDPDPRDFSSFLWQDLPGADLPADMTPEARAVQRLHTSGAYDLSLDEGALHLLVYAATPPVFDGPEDRNGRRNGDEAAFWLHLLAGDLPFPPPKPPFVIMGKTNLDPKDGEGKRDSLTTLMAHPALQDPAPRHTTTRRDPGARGDPALDTWVSKTGWGLRLDMILPSADLNVTGSGVLWPDPPDALAAILDLAGSHRPVWVTISLP